MNSTANIHRRFTLLFTLPSTTKTTALLLVASSPLILVTSLISKVAPSSMPFYFTIFELAIFLSIIIEHTVLKNNPLATFRRISFISVVSNGLWLIPVTLGFLVFPERLLSFIVIGAFFSTMFRLLVFGSIFINNPQLALSLAALQPLLLTLLLTVNSDLPTYLAQKPLLLGVGFSLIAAVLLYLRQVNRSGSDMLEAPALTLLQAFLKAWSAEEPSSIEDIIEKSSSKTVVKTSIITFYTDSVKPTIIVPEVHPGPFYPIGSSNLPFQLYRYFSEKGFSPLILHGVSGHESNLVSKKEVENLLSSYEHLNSLKGSNTSTRLVTVKSNNVVANGLAFGDYAVIFLTLSPNGMEDFPREIKKPLEEASLKNGFTHLFLVDTHNSQGSQVDREESTDLIAATKKMLKKLRKAEQHPFKIGFAHSSELGTNFERDIGPAGVGILIVEVGGDRYVLVAVDTNNARRGLREEVIDRLSAAGISVIEICTSDTHITAGKVLSTHGYMTLGDETSIESLVDVIKRLYEKAVVSLSESHFDVKYVDTEVKVVGADLLDNISKALDRVTGTARRGGFSLIALSLAVMLFPIFL